MDKVDRAILNLLQQDARSSQAEIGRRLGLSTPAIFKRIQRLEQSGIICGFSVRLDAAAIGQPVTALVRVVTRPFVNDEWRQFEQAVIAEPHIVACYDVDGEDSYCLWIKATSLEHLRDLVASLRSYPAVTRTITTIAMQAVKDPQLSAPLAVAAEDDC
ncbi:MAG: Lrp/AsnC family transcriptional regulator [Wenzhouxiangellaceae bacterium]